jgi:hypothetical protein
MRHQEKIMKGASRYPISQLTLQIISETASSEADFIINILGYRDAEQGLRRLRLRIDGGEGHQRIIGQISQMTGRGADLETAIAATRSRQDKGGRGGISRTM